MVKCSILGIHELDGRAVPYKAHVLGQVPSCFTLVQCWHRGFLDGLVQWVHHCWHA